MSRIAAIAFAGVFVVCAVVMGVVFAMNRGDDGVDANPTTTTFFSNATTGVASPAGVSHRVSGQGIPGGDSWASFSFGNWTFGRVNHQTNVVEPVGTTITRILTTYNWGGHWGNVSATYSTAFPAHHRIYSGQFTVGGQRPTTGMTFIGNTGVGHTTQIFDVSGWSGPDYSYGWTSGMQARQFPGGRVVASGQVVSHPMYALNVPAQFFLLVPMSHTVTFNSHGGTPVASQNVEHNHQVIQVPNPTRENHTFRHWSATQDGATPFSFATLITSATTINANNTLHAVWWVNPTVTFNSQGGSPTPPNQRPAHGGVIIRPADPTLANHTFRHWSETPGGATPWNFATTTTINRNLHAVWWVNPTITFNVQGGDSVTPPPQRPAHGGQIQRPEDPTRSGWNFRHWSTTPGGAVPWNFDHTVTTNQTLHAVWDIMVWRQLDFRVGNPLNNTSVTIRRNVEYLSTWYFRDFIPMEQDLVFLGWATTSENARNKVIAFGPNATMQVTINRTLYVVWDINWDHFPGLDGHNIMGLNFTGGINPDQPGGIIREERQFWSWDPMSRWLPSVDYMHAWEAEREPITQNRRTFLGWFDNSQGTGTARTSIPSTHSGPIEFWAIWIL